VDGADIEVWEAGFGDHLGQSATIVDGDANADGNIDGADFLLWQQNYGHTLTSAVAIRSVPEKQTLGLLVVGALIFIVRGYRQRPLAEL